MDSSSRLGTPPYVKVLILLLFLGRFQESTFPSQWILPGESGFFRQNCFMVELQLGGCVVCDDEDWPSRLRGSSAWRRASSRSPSASTRAAIYGCSFGSFEPRGLRAASLSRSLVFRLSAGETRVFSIGGGSYQTRAVKHDRREPCRSHGNSIHYKLRKNEIPGGREAKSEDPSRRGAPEPAIQFLHNSQLLAFLPVLGQIASDLEARLQCQSVGLPSPRGSKSYAETLACGHYGPSRSLRARKIARIRRAI